jgi:hypothetical protein
VGIGWVPTRYNREKVTSTCRHLKNYTRKIGIRFYVFIRGLRFGRSLSEGVVVNWKLHELFPILTVAGLMFKLSTKEQS